MSAPRRVPQNPKAERHLRHLINFAHSRIPYKVPQNPKAERHLRPDRLGEALHAEGCVPQNPKAERHLRLLHGFKVSRERRQGSPEPKSRKAFETHVID